jgi:pimeloyl-ACP methyl ester carboxylesterase
MRIAVATVLLATALIATAAPVGAGWGDDLAAVLDAPDGPERESLLSGILRAGPDWQDVAQEIQSIAFGPVTSDSGLVLTSNVCVDSVERPWVFQIPPSYDPSVPTPMLVVLHGGVSYPDITDDPLGEVRDNELGDLATEAGWISAFPFGQAGATWWDDVGMANVRALVREAKRRYNIDDDRVWVAGFSDGASSGFLYAMISPDDYAAVVALNGHMGVGSLDGDLPIYAPNMAATPVYATTTFDDGLYPSEKMRPSIEMARAAGADIFYHEMPGQHDFNDVVGQLPAIRRFLDRHPRDPFPTRIVWETGDTDFGRCRWFAIDAITTDEPAEWHADHNVPLVDDRVTIGFQPDYEFEGPGIMVAALSEGEYPARTMGLRAGDIILAAGTVRTDSLANLDEWKATVQRGDSFTMIVMRGGSEQVLNGELPDPAAYMIFKRDVPSAMARVEYAANRVSVETSRVGSFTVFVHPDMIALDQDLVITANGEVVFDGRVVPDVELMIRNFLENRDRRLLYVAAVPVSLQ